MVRVGAKIESGDVYVNKQVLKDSRYQSDDYMDKPAKYDGELASYVDKVVVS